MLEALELQGFFNLRMNSDWMATVLGTHMFPFTTKLFSGAFPIFETMYGPNQEIDLVLNIRNLRVIFGPYSGENMIFTSDIEFGLKKHNSMNYIIFDMFNQETSLNFELLNEVLFGSIENVRLNMAG
jgi:hypothetical protein